MPTDVLLVDANNLLLRAVHATHNRNVRLTAHDGTPTAALYVFINMLSRHVREEQPKKVVVCWDGGVSAYRTTLYPDYKAARRERPEEDEPEKPFAQAKEFLTLAGLHHVERAGWEADDLIACYWRTIRPIDTHITILSSDKDLLQLLGPNCVQVRVSAKPPTDRWDRDRVLAEFGCEPSQLALAMALAGDPGDGVPGIRGFGMKTAVKALAARKWQLEEVMADRPEEQQQMANLCYRLVDLRNIPYAMQGLRLAQPPTFVPTTPASMEWTDLLAFLDRYDLASVTSRLTDGVLWDDRSQESLAIG